METENITLPNGAIIEGVPVGTSKDLIKQKAIKNGLATEEDFGVTPKMSITEKENIKEDLPWYIDVKDFLKENMEIPAGLGGSVAGAMAGTPFGPLGMFVGTVAGGAFGSGGSSLLSDYFQGADLDYAAAVEEALISAGFDLATFGLGKKLSPAFVVAKRKLGIPTLKVAEDLIKVAKEGGEAGSQESLRASQKILTEKGATLLPYQTNKASGFDIFRQRLGEVGIISSKVMEDNAQRVNQVVSDSLNDIINRYGMGLTDNSALGEGLYQVIKAGKASMQDIYSKGLTEVQQKLGNKTVPTGIVKVALKKLLKQNETELGVMLDKDTIKLTEDFLKSLGDVKSVKGATMIDFFKKIGNDISKLGDLNSGVYNGTAERELAGLSSSLREALTNTLKTVDPQTALKYSALQKQYSKSLSGLLPEINANFIKRATKEDFGSLGRMLLGNGNLDSTRKFLSSIDKAYELAGKAGAKNLPFKSAKEAKGAIREAYLKNAFPDLGDEFAISKYRTFVNNFNNPNKSRKLKAILGEDYAHVKQLANLMKEASEKPSSNIGELVLRNKEYTALFGVGTAIAGTASAGVAGGGLAAGAVLLTPVLFSKMATNPKLVNKMLAFNKRAFKSKDALATAGGNLIWDILRSLPEEDQAEIEEASKQAEASKQ